ncbi:MAG: PIN domain-containing protein [Gemmatimonadaceae bacterium]
MLFDTNVVLDVLLARQPHAPVAVQLFELVARKDLAGVLGATTVTTIYYLAAKAAGAKAARRHVATLLGLFDVAAVTRAVLADALTLGFRDYEDAVLHEGARHAGATGIVTRDAAGFRRARLRIYTPDELLRFMAATSAS